MRLSITAFWCYLETIVIGLRPVWMLAVINIIIAFTLHHEQSVDIIRFVALDNGFFSRIHMMLFLSLSLLMFCNWYFSQALLSVRYRFTPNDNRFGIWVIITPQVFFLLPAISLVTALIRIGILSFAVFYLLWTGLFYFVVFKLLQRKKVFTSNPLEFPEAISRSTFHFMAFLLFVSGSLLCLFLIVPVSAPECIGPLGVLLYTGAAWVAFSSCVLAYPVHRFRLPSFVVTGMLCAMLFGIWNENHHIRRAPGRSVPVARKSVRTHMYEWLEKRSEQLTTTDTIIPVFIVSAEGGGIRAAYWTASVLSYLEDEYPGFGTEVFAISGVSGGSLGAAVFTALLAENLTFFEKNPVAAVSLPRLLPDARAILSHDFLSPTIASFLFPDLMQRFWPFSDRYPFGGKLALPDRASYLERSWEVAWRKSSDSDRFREQFMQLWSNPKYRLLLPSLFFNGTWVESGRRCAMSNCSIDTTNFAHLDDIASVLDYPVRLSTAVNMSSRFPYLSPAGTVDIDGRKQHVVDGAYFENSGALTAEELLVLLRKIIRENESFSVFKPVAILITNTPLNPCSRSNQKQTKVHKVPKMLIGSSAPVRAFLNTRLARGYLAERQFQKTAGDENTIRFHLEELEDVSIPLGWILSGKARRLIDRQLETHSSVKMVGTLLASSTE